MRTSSTIYNEEERWEITKRFSRISPEEKELFLKGVIKDLEKAKENKDFKSTIDNIMVDPNMTNSQRYNAMTQLYYNQQGNADNQAYLMDSYMRLMNANNTSANSSNLVNSNYGRSYGRPNW